MENKVSAKDLEKLKILVTIVNRGKGNYFVDTLENFTVNFQTIVLGKGTANSEVLDMLGLDETEKDIVISFVKDDEVKQIMETLNEKFAKVKKSKGVAFTIPVKSVVGFYLYQFLSNTRVRRN